MRQTARKRLCKYMKVYKGQLNNSMEHSRCVSTRLNQPINALCHGVLALVGACWRVGCWVLGRTLAWYYYFGVFP